MNTYSPTRYSLFSSQLVADRLWGTPTKKVLGTEGRWRLAVGRWQLAIGRWQLAAGSSWLTANGSRLTAS